MKFINNRNGFKSVLLIFGTATPLLTRMGVGLMFLSLLFSCAIKDDLPLPIRKAVVTAFEVEGQCDETGEGYAEATIDNDKRLIELYVDDRVDITKLRVKRMNVTFDASIAIEDLETAFPEKSFSATGSDCPVLDFTNEITFVLTTYQTYRWKVRVHQIIKREVYLVGQVGDAIIDPSSQSVVVYVSSKKNFKAIQVKKFMLGGIHGTINPDPMSSDTFDFSSMRIFQVKLAGVTEPQEWRVFVYPTDAIEGVEASAFVRSVSATISGTIPIGTQPVVEYHASTTNVWTTVSSSQVRVQGARFEADITGLRPGAVYTYRITSGNAESEELSFTTVAEQQLENGGFDDWSITKGSSGKDLYQPWGEGKESYWDTGNSGATSVGSSNSTYKDEDGRRFANLQSKFIVLKFAAGNIFTGQYVDTEGTNGILSFGRPFSAFPTKMRFEYRYKTSPITKTGGEWKEVYGKYINRETYEGLKGQPDSCNIYIALGDWEPVMYDGTECPLFIYTLPTAADLHLFDPNDSHVIAYAQMTKGEDVNTWTTETLTLNYRVTNRQPKYIIVVASSSKYGDFFTGGVESLLQIDNMELLYE